MAESLTNVLMFTKQGWKQVTAQEAALLHPGGTVSAKGGLFICGYCGQPVTFTCGSKQIRHFRHSKHEQDKSCKERTITSGGNSVGTTLNRQRVLPLYLRVLSRKDFLFQVGVSNLPESILSDKSKIKISTSTHGSNSSQDRIFTLDRLLKKRMTYFDLGSIPISKLCLQIVESDMGKDKVRYAFTGMEITKNLTLFNASSGKMIPYLGNVIPDEEYYLLSNGELPGYMRRNSDISLEGVSRKGNWFLFKISFLKMDENTARFVHEIGYLLSSCHSEMSLLWPCCYELDNLYHSPSKNLYLYSAGLNQLLLFPYQTPSLISNDRNEYHSIWKLNSNERQQLISQERNGIQNSITLWKDSLDRKNKTIPNISIQMINNENISFGEYDELPPSKRLIIECPFDGEIQIFDNKEFLYRIKTHANKRCPIDKIINGMKIKIFQGFDEIGCIGYSETHVRKQYVEEDQILRSGPPFITPPSYAFSLLRKLPAGSAVHNWLRKGILRGELSKQGLSLLQGMIGLK